MIIERISHLNANSWVKRSPAQEQADAFRDKQTANM